MAPLYGTVGINAEVEGQGKCTATHQCQKKKATYSISPKGVSVAQTAKELAGV